MDEVGITLSLGSLLALALGPAAAVIIVMLIIWAVKRKPKEKKSAKQAE